ncbi:BRO family protein [Streptomyces sp. NPDC001599]|uniref:BRO family protein n=1 Tax=Streptomyces sp. NPDC001599 TaxID=3364591 RepID=UPI0036BF2330
MSVVQLPSIFRAIQEIFPDTVLRTGFSTQHQASFIVAADLREGLGYRTSTAKFVESLKKAQESMKGRSSAPPLYVGQETIPTAGGPQTMRVIYRRGCYHLVSRSDLPKAAEYRDQVYDLLEQIEREGFVVNADAPLAQLQEMPQQMVQTVDDLVLVRKLEIRDYRKIRHAIWEAGGDREDFRDVRTALYEILFGLTPAAIRQTRPQVGGERYKRDYRNPRTGTFHQAGELRPSDATPDYLTEDELRRLDDAVLWVTTTLSFRFPEGYATLGDILDVLQQFAAQVRSFPKLKEKNEPASKEQPDLRSRIESIRAKLQRGA